MDFTLTSMYLLQYVIMIRTFIIIGSQLQQLIICTCTRHFYFLKLGKRFWLMCNAIQN